MASTVPSSELWALRAQEVREAANKERDRGVRRHMLEIAEAYERLAQRVRLRRASVRAALASGRGGKENDRQTG